MSSKMESIYQNMPIPIQNLMCSIEGWRINHYRYGKVFKTLLKEALERETWSKDQILNYRDNKIKNFIQHSVNTTPYYTNLFNELDLAPDAIKGLDDLKKLPILKKSQVQENPELFRSSKTLPKNARVSHTSGSTGSGLHFWTTQEALCEQWAIWWRYRFWHGISKDTWCGYFGGRSLVPNEQKSPPFWRVNPIGKQWMYSTYHLSDTTALSYLKHLKYTGVKWLHGYPSFLALLASYALSLDFDLSSQIKWVTIGAESLLPQQSSIIEKSFGVTPIQHYGMAEGIANISQHADGNLVVDEDFSAVEFIKENDETKVIGTNFSNWLTPLIRYDVGDLVYIDKNKPLSNSHLRGCRCVESIDGRKEDYIKLPSGKKIGRLDHIFKDLIDISEAQIIQHNEKTLDIYIVKGKNYSSVTRINLLKELQQRIGLELKLITHEVDKLTRTKSGKLRFVISKLI